jgi:hypothetical protein
LTIPLIERLTKGSSDVILQGRVRSAVYAPLLLCGAITPLSLALAFRTAGIAQAVFFAFGFLPLALFAVLAIYFMVKDPDRLMSENYNIQKRALLLIEEKGGAIPLSATSVQAIANPNFEQNTLRSDS